MYMKRKKIDTQKACTSNIPAIPAINSSIEGGGRSAASNMWLMRLADIVPFIGRLPLDKIGLASSNDFYGINFEQVKRL